MNPRNQPIGVFDSGVGGLTVVRALRDRLPNESILYLGDTARVPYGNKAPETIQRYSVNIARYLVNAGVKMIVIACNTASAYAFEAVQHAVEVPVIDVIRPVARAIGADATVNDVLVLGTRGTVQSGSYVRHLRAARETLAVHQQACPLFVPLAEEGWLEGEVPDRVAGRYLGPVATERRPDAAILGCTHYPLLADVIQRALDHGADRPVRLFDSGVLTAALVAETLAAQDLDAPDTHIGHERYHVTDDADAFVHVASRFLGRPVPHARHVDLVG